jgi:outer membrane protein assembly factor BamB
MYAREDALFVDTTDAFATLDPESGNVAWTVPLEMSVDEVRFEPDSIHVWAGDALRIQRNTGRVEWRTGGEPYSDGTLSTELAYSSRLKDWVEDIGTGAIDALERDTGDSRWSFAGPTDAEIVHTTDGYALLAAVSGSLGNERSREIYLLDPDDGSDQWSIDVDDGHVVSGDALFVADGANIHGLGLVNDPAAFAHSDSGTDTSGPSDSSPPADQKREETGHESDSATESDAMSDSNSDDETPAFCPECGGSLSEYENPTFCIHCGREL